MTSPQRRQPSVARGWAVVCDNTGREFRVYKSQREAEGTAARIDAGLAYPLHLLFADEDNTWHKHSVVRQNAPSEPS